jgi:hypothetical protein
MVTINLSAKVTANRQLKIKLPRNVPEGLADIVVHVTSQKKTKRKKGKTFGDLLDSKFFGMWADRTDIKDSVEFARKLREDAWKRK